MSGHALAIARSSYPRGQPERNNAADAGAILCDQATVELVQSARFPHVAVLLTPVEQPAGARALFLI
jgi:hypothetical protein